MVERGGKDLQANFILAHTKSKYSEENERLRTLYTIFYKGSY